MTIRGAFADIFWFTLFHELGHLLNGDITGSNFIDFEGSKSNIEEQADVFARDLLVNDKDFNKFINLASLTEIDIIEFANKQKVQPFIVVGRIQREKNNYRLFSNLKIKYKWK